MITLVEGIKGRSKCDWLVKNILSFSRTLKKKRGVQNHIHKVICDEKEIAHPKKTTQKICNCYETLFRKQSLQPENEQL